jgi:ATP/maltotriose-dependent transcriptional regulator MalT
LEDSRRHTQQAIHLYEKLRIVWGISLATRMQARTVFELGDHAEALRLAHRSLNVEWQNRLWRYALGTLVVVAELYLASNRQERALALLSLIDSARQELPILDWEVQIVTGHLANYGARSDSPRFEAAIALGRTLDLETTVLAVCDELSRLIEIEARPVAVSPDALTLRELEVLQLVADGCSNREIARQLVLSLGTVKWYTSDIYSKLNVKNRTQAVAMARELGLLT